MSSVDPLAWVVHKFGGSSVADAQCFERVARIVDSQRTSPSQGSASQSQPGRPRLAIVLSACKGVTDALLELVAQAASQDLRWREGVSALRERHAVIAQALLDERGSAEYLAELDLDLGDVNGVLQATSVMRSASQPVRDLIAGFGELWSTRLFHRYLQRRAPRGTVQWLDARRCLIIEWEPLGPAVHWQESKAKLQALLPPEMTPTATAAP